MIPLIKPNLPKPKEWWKYLKKSYEANHFSNGGPCSNLLESRLKKYLNTKHDPLLVSNATVGLTIALNALNLPKDSEVIIPSFTFSATAHSVLNANLKPVLADCGNDSFLCLNDITKKISSRTKVFIVVQALGFSCDYKKYEKFAKQNNLILIFDSAALLGADYKDGKKVGVAGDFEIFSLHATKTFGIGEGGLITSKHKNLLEHCRKQTNFGFENGFSVHCGTNAKLSEISCAIGNSALDGIAKKLSSKDTVASWYKFHLKDTDVCYFNGNSAHQVFPVVFKDKATRDKIKKILDKNKIGNRIYYIPIHVQEFFKNLNVKDKFPKSEYFYEHILCLPIYDDLRSKDVTKICKVIKDNL